MLYGAECCATKKLQEYDTFGGDVHASGKLRNVYIRGNLLVVSVEDKSKEIIWDGLVIYMKKPEATFYWKLKCCKHKEWGSGKLMETLD